MLWVTLLVASTRCAGGMLTGPAERARATGPVAHGPTPASPADAAVRGSEASVAASIHLALGVPRDRDASDDFFLDEGAFALSYNPVKRVPNWVAWRLDRANFGRARRNNDFHPDLALPARFYRVGESDYLHSGYDRGHLCPSGDRKNSAAENFQTFVFTNMQPQLHELNAGPWEQLEVYARHRAERGEVLYQIAGGVFTSSAAIGNGVAVPSANYKIIVCLQQGERASDLTRDTVVLAVLMPNQPGVGAHDWSEYLTSVDTIERATGYDFLPAVPEPVQQVLEARIGQP